MIMQLIKQYFSVWKWCGYTGCTGLTGLQGITGVPLLKNNRI